QFKEFMHGWFSTHVPDRDDTAGEPRGPASGSVLDAHLTVTFDDLEELLANPAIPGELRGEVLVSELSPFPLEVTAGEFRLFERDPEHVETWNMRYSMDLTSNGANRYRIEGVKVLHDDPGFDVWKDTTTLFVRILDDRNATLGSGILRVSVT